MYSIVLGYLLDWIVGEPHNPVHPVCLMAKLMVLLEKGTRRLFPKRLKLAGLITWVLTVLVTFFLSFGILRLASLHWLALLLVGGIMVYFCIAPRGLCQEANKVVDKLKAGDLPGARKQLSMIVGRDTQNLTETQILRAVIETVAENFSDGVAAPLLFIGLGGPAWGMLYKAVNTMDSMFGYKNERYGEFGYFPARLDDLFNYIPARISAFLVMGASFLCGLDGRNAAKVWKRDKRKHSSPNSAQPESAFAGALGISMGGANFYGDRLVEKPVIGEELRPVDFVRVKESERLMLVSTFLCLLVSVALSLIGLWH